MFQFSIRISRTWVIANTFDGFTQLNINLLSTINQSNFVINTKTNFNNTVNMDINMVNMVMHSTEKVIKRIIGRVKPPRIPNKLTLVHTKFKFTSFRNSFNFSDTDQTQTKKTKPNRIFFNDKLQNHQTCQVHNLNHRYFKTDNRFNYPKKNRLQIYRPWDNKQPRFFFFFSKNIPCFGPKNWKKRQKNENEQFSGYW